MASQTSSTPRDSSDSGDIFDFNLLTSRLRRGRWVILGLASLGLAAGALFSVLVMTRQPVVTTLRVSFGFPGFERGLYPNGTKFQADDVRSPDVINEALKRIGGEKLAPDLASKIRGSLSISGFVSPNIVKERDRLRAAGQNPPPYIPDEYELSLSLPRNHPLGVRQRELLLAEIIHAFGDKFRRTYVDLPPDFGNAFQSLRNADFVEYELILSRELQSLHSYLEQKIDTDRETNSQEKNEPSPARVAKQFRSPTNNLSFEDLLKETDLFAQIRLNDVLSQIYTYGLSKDRNYAVIKMDYHLRTLEDQEQRLQEEETVVANLLTKTQERAQNYVLASKTQVPQGSQPMLDQGFIDTLLANDAYNFLVRRALEAGLAVKRIEAEKIRLQERRKRMESFAKSDAKDQTEAISNMQKSLASLESSYQELLTRVRATLDDYSRQEFADAMRISLQARTTSLLESILLAGLLGIGIGVAAGVGWSLIQEERAGPRG